MKTEAAWEVGEEVSDDLSFAPLGPKDVCEHNPLRGRFHGLHVTLRRIVCDEKNWFERTGSADLRLLAVLDVVLVLVILEDIERKAMV